MDANAPFSVFRDPTPPAPVERPTPLDVAATTGGFEKHLRAELSATRKPGPSPTEAGQPVIEATSAKEAQPLEDSPLPDPAHTADEKNPVGDEDVSDVSSETASPTLGAPLANAGPAPLDESTAAKPEPGAAKPAPTTDAGAPQESLGAPSADAAVLDADQPNPATPFEVPQKNPRPTLQKGALAAGGEEKPAAARGAANRVAANAAEPGGAPIGAPETGAASVSPEHNSWKTRELSVAQSQKQPEGSAASSPDAEAVASPQDTGSAETDHGADAAQDSPRARLAGREADESTRLAAADRVRLVQRVARAVEAARPDGEIRLRLRPPELGSVHLRMKMEDGALLARIETETVHARALLTEHLPELRERLAEMEIRVERFDVQWRGGSDSHSSPQQEFAQSGERWSQDSRGGRGQQDAREPVPVASPTRRSHQGDLDVVV